MIYVYRLIGGLIGSAIYFIIIRNITIAVPASWVLYLVFLCSGTYMAEKLYYRSKRDKSSTRQTRD